MRDGVDQAVEIGAARLAFLTEGQPALSAPRRAVAEGERPETAEPVADTTAPVERQPEVVEPVADAKVPVGRQWLSRLPRWQPSRPQFLVIAAVLCCGIAVAVAAMGRSQAVEVPQASYSAGPQASPAPTVAPEAEVRVHVVGAVVKPGVVSLPEGSIVQDAIVQAGGLRPDADAAMLNLAARVSDGQQIIIGTFREPLGEVTGDRGSQSQQSAELLDLNTASAQQLEELPGVGPVLAGAIVAWREEHERFSSVAELQEVSGIGPKVFARLQPLVRV